MTDLSAFVEDDNYNFRSVIQLTSRNMKTFALGTETVSNLPMKI